MVETTSLNTLDIVTIVFYILLVMTVGVIATVTADRTSAAGFFLANKSISWIPIAGSIFATNMGAPTLVGLAGSGAAAGIAPVMFEWHATYMLVLLGWVFVPIYMASGTFTMPEYLKKRYGGRRLRIYYAVVQVLLSVLTGISTEIYAGSVFVYQILGLDLYLSTVLILSVTAIYTVGGGLAAVIYTDTLQTVILVIGTTILSILALDKVGGYDALVNRYSQAMSNMTWLAQAEYGNLSCGAPPSDAFHIFRAVDSDHPWPGFTFGLTLLAIYFFCTNQTIVQRTLAAKSVSHSKAACVLASYLKLLPVILFVIPGMISRVLYPEEVACSDPVTCADICDNEFGCSDLAFPLLVLRIMPQGLRGLMLAALLSALMSSLTSIFNSTSSVFTLDIYSALKGSATEREVIVVGRLFTLFLVMISISWLPILQEIKGSQLWDYLQSISAYITPSWVVIFLMGMFWSRTTEPGAWWGLMVGLAVGTARMGVHFAYDTPKCGDPEPDTRPPVFTSLHYLHFAILLAACTFIVTLAVSLLTDPRSTEQLHRVTWATRHDQLEPVLTDDDYEDSSEEEPETDCDSSKEEDSRCKVRRVFSVLCGLEGSSQTQLSDEDLLSWWAQITDISETPLWSTLCNINAAVAITITCFIIGFYF